MKRILIVICCILFIGVGTTGLLGQGAAPLPSKSLEDFEDEKNRDFRLISEILDSVLSIEPGTRIKSKFTLKDLWDKDRKAFRVPNDRNNARIDTLFAKLKIWAEDDLPKQVPTTSVDNFAKIYDIGWCTEKNGWRTQKSTNESCPGVDERNFDFFRYHLIYSFVRIQIENLNYSPPSKDRPLDLEKRVTELEKRIKELNSGWLTVLIIIASLLLGAIAIAILNWFKIRNSRKKIGKLAGNRSSPPPVTETVLIRKSSPPEPINEPAQVQNQITQIPRSTNSSEDTAYKPYRSSKEKKKKNKEKPVPLPPPKVTLFAEIPNPSGVVAKIHKVENNKSYFKLLLQEEDSTKGEITLVNNPEKRNRAFNTPNTHLPSSICAHNYAGTIDYSGRVHIEPGRVQKLPNSSAWEVTSPITITLR